MELFSKNIFLVAAFCLALSGTAYAAAADDDPLADNAQMVDGIQVSQADTQMLPAAKHAKAKHAKKKSHKKTKYNTGAKERVRSAQIYLEELGYNPGKADGIMGRRTKTALQTFQRDYQLKPSGMLTNKTFDLLATAVQEKRRPPQPAAEVLQLPSTPELFTKHADFYGFYGADYSNPLQFGSPQAIPNRFGDMQIVDQPQTDGMHQYMITLNGQSIFHAAGQPSVINLSRTFNLEGADIVVLSSYAGLEDNICPYRHYLMVVRANSYGVHEIGNCTRAYEAYVDHGSLFVAFPEGHMSGWSSGSIWRYDHGTLQRL